LNDKAKLADGGETESIRNGKEFINYNPIKINNDLVKVNDKDLNNQINKINGKESVDLSKLDELEKQYKETLKLQQDVLNQIKLLKHSRGDKMKGVKKDKKKFKY